MHPATPPRSARPSTHPRLRRVATGLVAGLLALAFLGVGVPKLLGLPTPGGSEADFERWGYPAGARNVVGLAEVAGAVLLLLPRPAPARLAGAALVAAVLAGAIGTHLLHGETGAALFPATLLVLAGVVAALARPRSRAATTGTVASAAPSSAR